MYSGMSERNERNVWKQVKATDGGTPAKSVTCRVSILVVPVPAKSKHPPIVKTPQPTEITERDDVGYLVALIQASDQDNDTLWYDIVGKFEFTYLLSLYLIIILISTYTNAGKFPNVQPYEILSSNILQLARTENVKKVSKTIEFFSKAFRNLRKNKSFLFMIKLMKF